LILYFLNRDDAIYFLLVSPLMDIGNKPKRDNVHVFIYDDVIDKNEYLGYVILDLK